MRNETLTTNHRIILNTLSEPLLRKSFFYHDIRITYYTNSASLLTQFDDLLDIYPQPEQVRGEVDYAILCYESASQFAVQLPVARKHSETIKLITGTRLRYYSSLDDSVEYHRYSALPSMNGPALSAIYASENFALTQIEQPEAYQPLFLRRCVLLLTLGQLVRPFHFEACHAAAITAPWDSQQAALIFGSSGSGKTTLSLGCTVQGYGLIGDDLVMLRENTAQHDISAYSLMPEVSVRAGTLDLWSSLSFLQAQPPDNRGKRHCLIEQIRPGALILQAPIRLLLFPTLIEARESSVVSMSKAEALQGLIEHCMRIEKAYPPTQEQLFLLLVQLTEQARSYRMMVASHAADYPSLLGRLFAGGSYE
ncbi:MAG TPA: hypothetical protein VNE38_08035 [Ktedonobacteraceae bacterium]|nr:hypothetical protein [Ktedonobacteraceae bacterium]